MSLTYWQQLKRPEWQRKRLEVMSAADFRCQCCGTKDELLHVHHKRYVKGRVAWEYPNSELECLCDGCHALAHAAKDLISEVVASISTSQWIGAAVLLAARFDITPIDPEFVELVDQDPYNGAIGRIAGACTHLSIDDIELLLGHIGAIAASYVPVTTTD